MAAGHGQARVHQRAAARGLRQVLRARGAPLRGRLEQLLQGTVEVATGYVTTLEVHTELMALSASTYFLHRCSVFQQQYMDCAKFVVRARGNRLAHLRQTLYEPEGAAYWKSERVLC